MARRRQLDLDDDDYDNFDGEVFDEMAPDEEDTSFKHGVAYSGGDEATSGAGGGLLPAGFPLMTAPRKQKGGKKEKKRKGKKQGGAGAGGGRGLAGGLFGAVAERTPLPTVAPPPPKEESPQPELPRHTANGGGVGEVGSGVGGRAAAAHTIQESKVGIESRKVHRRGRERIKTTAAVELPSLPAAVERALSRGRSRVSLVVVGHVDAGKSTLLGHLLFQLGEVDERQMGHFRRDAAAMGKSSFAFAWVMDAGADERSRGVTVDVGSATFSSEHSDFTLLDAPGHRDFVPNMITGAAQADAAVLVVPAPAQEFERSFERSGQTREHAILLHSLGVRQVIVAVNKMDRIDWDEEQFRSVCSKVGRFLVQSVGFSHRNVVFIPVSGLRGVNLTRTLDEEASALSTGEPSPAAATEEEAEDQGVDVETLNRSRAALLRGASHWYANFTQEMRVEAHAGKATPLPPAMHARPALLHALDALRPGHTRAVLRPLRLTVSEVQRGGSGKEITAIGRVESGWIGPHQRLCARPGSSQGIVKAMAIMGATGPEEDEEGEEGGRAERGGGGGMPDWAAAAGESPDFAWAGMTVQLVLGGFDEGSVKRGSVLCWTEHPVPVAGEIKAEVQMLPLDSTLPLVEGQQLVFHTHNVECPCNLVRLKHTVDASGAVLDRHPRSLPRDALAVVRIRFVKPVAVEPFKTHPKLGRFLLRYSGRTVAAGLVQRIYK